MERAYSLRAASAADAAAIARQRALMFLDMGLIGVDETDALAAATEPWIAEIVEGKRYIGWMVERDGIIVAGGGLHLSEIGPLPELVRVGTAAHIANVYTYAEHRKRGIARLLLTAMLDWCRQSGIDQVTLTASEDGRNLYRSIGFAPQPDGMLLKLYRDMRHVSS